MTAAAATLSAAACKMGEAPLVAASVVITIDRVCPADAAANVNVAMIWLCANAPGSAVVSVTGGAELSESVATICVAPPYERP